MPYIYKITRRDSTNRQPAKAGVSVSVKSAEPSYRDLQAHAKTLGIPGNQTADDLKKAIEDAT